MIQLRAPLARAMTTLDRALFSQKFPLAAAAVREPRHLARYRKDLIHEAKLFNRSGFNPVLPHPDPELARAGRKLLLLSPEVKHECTPFFSLFLPLTFFFSLRSALVPSSTFDSASPYLLHAFLLPPFSFRPSLSAKHILTRGWNSKGYMG